MPAAKGSARTPLGPTRPFLVATYVYASNQGQRTHSARTKMKGQGQAGEGQADGCRESLWQESRGSLDNITVLVIDLKTFKK